MKKISNSQAGSSFIEILVSCTVLLIGFMALAEIMRFNAIVRHDVTSKSNENLVFEKINVMISDKMSCSNFLAGVNLTGLGSGSVTNLDTAKVDEVLSGAGQNLNFKVTAILLTKLTDPLVNDVRSIQMIFELERKGLFLGSPVIKKIFPIFVRVDASKNILGCGTIHTSRSYCETLRGQWDEVNQVCIYNQKRACEMAGGKWADSNGDNVADFCSYCTDVGGVPSGKNCGITYNGTDTPTTIYNGGTGATPYKYKLIAGQPDEIVQEWYCDSWQVPKCDALIGNMCTPSAPVNCVIAVTEEANITTKTPAKCKVTKLTCSNTP